MILRQDISCTHVYNLRKIKISQIQGVSYYIFIFKAKISLKGVFIDAFYDSDNEHEAQKFSDNVQTLWDFAANANPFECKDIKIALTELMEAQVSKMI